MSEWNHLTDESKARWEQNAGYWDDYMGENSNRWHRELIRPETERLLDVREGQMILDIACGNGNFTRRLVELGANVTAFDYSAAMVERAKERSKTIADRIDYRVMDATSEADWAELPESGFDGVVSNMALMDIADIVPLARGLGRCLKPGGSFVFSVPHPCFRAPGTRHTYETEDRNGEVVSRSVIHVSQYKTTGYYESIGIVGQPVPHFMFHRTISDYMNVFGGAGFVLNGMAEPVFDKRSGDSGKFEWNEIAPVLIMRFRKDETNAR